MTDWFSQLKKAKKSCIVDGKLKRVHFDFGDGREMVEEYNLDTNVVTRRAWRCNRDLKGEDKWEVEIGDPEPMYNKEEMLMIQENSNQVLYCVNVFIVAAFLCRIFSLLFLEE